MPAQVVDPWLEADPFGPPLVDFNIHPDDVEDPDAPPLDQHPGLNPEIVPPVTPDPEVPPTPVEDETPEVFEVDGGTISLEKEKGQWKVTIASDSGGQPQVYWGKTKNELIVQAMGKAQLNATKKIRDLNLKVKLGGTAPKPTPAVQPLSNTLTADEIFEVKTQLESNPDLALETWFQKKTGLSVAQLVTLAQKGAAADASLSAEQVAKDFIARNPEYYADPQSKNVGRIITWLAKFKLGQPTSTVEELYNRGFWTVEAVEEAYQDLNDEGLLVKAPKPTTLPPATPPAEPPAARTDERIVRTETRPRAGLGIRPTDVTPAPPPEAPKPPSVEDLDNLSDEQVRQLMAGVRRTKIMSRRS